MIGDFGFLLFPGIVNFCSCSVIDLKGKLMSKKEDFTSLVKDYKEWSATVAIYVYSIYVYSFKQYVVKTK